jgi:hypothetical protein
MKSRSLLRMLFYPDVGLPALMRPVVLAPERDRFARTPEFTNRTDLRRRSAPT